jgi:protein-disulfide isomerase
LQGQETFMTTKTQPEQRGFWRKRATYAVGATTRQRKAQYKQQMNALLIALLVAVIAGGLFIWINWTGAGSTKSVSCNDYPQFCVPFAGGAAGNIESIASNEAAGVRELDESSKGAPGVVRGYEEDMIFLGDPSAPIHFAVVLDFACSHCQDYHESDLPRFIDDYVLTGQATVQFVFTTGTGGSFSETASQAALCAGEQGAAWEMTDEIFRLTTSMGIQNAASISQLRNSAEDMGLDGDELTRCVASGNYRNFIVDNYRNFSNDHGVTGTPSVLASYGDTQEWTLVNRDYGSLQQMTDAANAQ